MLEYLEIMVDGGTRHADTLVDVGRDLGDFDGLDAFERLRNRLRGRLDLRLGAYNPLGFRDDDPGRWELFVEAARRSDFVGSLPERDDRRRAPGHVGFDEHCRRLVGLAMELGKPLHVHVDQVNHPRENGTERLLRVADELGYRGEPRIWLIHVISPSTYEEPRFEALLQGMLDAHVGVICPSAAISMRQSRATRTPTFNSIARVLEMSAHAMARGPRRGGGLPGPGRRVFGPERQGRARCEGPLPRRLAGVGPARPALREPQPVRRAPQAGRAAGAAAGVSLELSGLGGATANAPRPSWRQAAGSESAACGEEASSSASRIGVAFSG